MKYLIIPGLILAIASQSLSLQVIGIMLVWLATVRRRAA